MWWQMYFAAILTKYVVLMYLRRNYIRNGVESGVESGVECSETNIRKLRFGIVNFRDACISRRKEVEIWDQLPRHMRFQTHALLDAFLSIFRRS
jgi:hypothetical protein